MTSLMKDLAAYAASGSDVKPAPVHLWDPPFCGDIDLRIAADGTWYYMGSPIGRAALVRLFASVLKREADGKFFLVTPQEKVGITVEEAPFVGVLAQRQREGTDQRVTIETNVGEQVMINEDHSLRVEINSVTGEPAPFVHIRSGLDAKLNRPTFYDIVDWSQTDELNGKAQFGLWSGGHFFPMADGDLLAEMSLGE